MYDLFCSFTDPTLSFVGLDTFRRNLAGGSLRPSTRPTKSHNQALCGGRANKCKGIGHAPVPGKPYIYFPWRQ
jgi:hypothetical protein